MNPRGVTRLGRCESISLLLVHVLLVLRYARRASQTQICSALKNQAGGDSRGQKTRLSKKKKKEKKTQCNWHQGCVNPCLSDVSRTSSQLQHDILHRKTSSSSSRDSKAKPRDAEKLRQPMAPPKVPGPRANHTPPRISCKIPRAWH